MASTFTRFVFFFGKNPVLSLVELANYAKTNSLNWTIEPAWNNAALVTANIHNPKVVVERLGGTIKIAVIKHELATLKPADVAKTAQESKWLSLLPDKFVFATSCLGLNGQQEQTVTDHLKLFFKKQNYKAVQKTGSNRKTTTDEIASPSEIAKWNLLENQTDICVIKTPTSFEIGYTIAVSNPKDWKFRDEHRPFKDSKELVSIRLAKMLLNIAATQEKHTVLDPFCGYGTILQEAMLQNWNAVGIEKDEKKARQAEKNLKWCQHQFKTTATFKIYTGFAQQADRLVTEPIDLVVCEPYMGPYLTRTPNPHHAEDIIAELIPLYRQMFESLFKKLKPKQTVCMILPVLTPFQSKAHTIPTAVFSEWFSSKNPLAEFGEKYGGAVPFEYYNPGNLIKRQIWILEKK